MSETTYGYPFAIGEAVIDALKGCQPLAGVPVRVNPEKPADLQDGRRLVIFKDLSDAERGQSGNADARVYSFQVGVIARTEEARKTAHADYHAARRAVREAIQRMIENKARVSGQVSENNVIYQIETIDVGGCLILGSFAVPYRAPNQ